MIFMSELEALNWLKNCREFILDKIEDRYELSSFGYAVRGDSVIDCVVKIKMMIKAGA